MLWFSCDLIVFQYNYHRCYRTCYLCFFLCLFERTPREQVQLVEAAHVHVDGTPEHVKHVKNTQFEVGSWQVADFGGLYFVGHV